MFSLVHVLVWRDHVRHVLLLVLEDILDAGPGPGVHDVVPVLGGVGGQLLPPLHDEDAGVADLAVPRVLQLEAANTILLIFLTVCESGAKNKCTNQFRDGNYNQKKVNALGSHS